MFASSSPVSAFISTLLASLVIAHIIRYPVPFPHQFRGHPFSPVVARLFLISEHLSISHIIVIPPSPRHPVPDLRGTRLLTIHSARSHHSRTSRAHLWSPFTPWLLAQLQLYMVSISRPLSAFMHSVSLLTCFFVCVSPFLHVRCQCVCFARTPLLRNSDPSTTRKLLPLATWTVRYSET